VDEGLVAVEQPVPAGEQVALEPALAQVLGEHLHHPPVGRQVVVVRQGLGHPGAVGDFEHGRQTVGGRLVGSDDAERVRVAAHDVAQPDAEDAGGLAAGGVRSGHVDGVVVEVGQVEVATQPTPVGVGGGPHATVTVRRQAGDVGAQPAPVEQLVGPVAAHPRLELAQVLGVLRQCR
jgi:hypothetical protein